MDSFVGVVSTAEGIQRPAKSLTCRDFLLRTEVSSGAPLRVHITISSFFVNARRERAQSALRRAFAHMADNDKVERKGERLTEPDWLTGCTCAARRCRR
jgi:hypothetical protein